MKESAGTSAATGARTRTSPRRARPGAPGRGCPATARAWRGSTAAAARRSARPSPASGAQPRGGDGDQDAGDDGLDNQIKHRAAVAQERPNGAEPGKRPLRVRKTRGVPRHAPWRSRGVGALRLRLVRVGRAALEIEHAPKVQRRQAEMGFRRLRVAGPAGQLERWPSTAPCAVRSLSPSPTPDLPKL